MARTARLTIVLILAGALRTVAAAAQPDTGSAPWAEARMHLATGDLAPYAVAERARELGVIMDPASSSADRFAALLRADGLLLRERSRRRALADADASSRSLLAALEDSIAFHVTLDPVQRIVDFRDDRFRVEVPPYPRLDYREAFTHSVWVRLDGNVTVDQTKVLSHAGVASCKSGIFLGRGNRPEIVIGLDNGAMLLERADCSLATGTWTHLALTFDRRTGPALYVDGARCDLRQGGDPCTPGAGVRPLPDQILYLGGLDRILPGWLDDVRIFDRALDPGAIRRLASGEDVSGGLIGRWTFDEESGDLASNLVAGGTEGRLGAGVIRTTGSAVQGRGCLRFSRAREDWVAELRRLEERQAEIERKLSEGAGAPDAPPAVDAVLATLQAHGAVLLAYVIDEVRDDLAAFVVDPRRQDPVSVVSLGPASEIAALAEAVERELTADSRRTAAGERRYVEIAGELARRIWLPVAGTLGDGGEVWLRLPPQLHGIPFSALPDGTGGYLVQRFAFARTGPLAGLSRTPPGPRGATAVLVGNPTYTGIPGAVVAPLWAGARTAEDRDRGPGTTGCLTPARPLHGTHRELQHLERLLREDRYEVRTLAWQDAYEDRLKEGIGDPRILHLATHSYRIGADCLPAVPRDPLYRIGLQLAGVARARPEDSRREDDGLLSAAEFARLPLQNTTLVVFSGCATATGEFANGEGPLGLTAAAWIAGAGASLGTLWNVDDDAMPEAVLAFCEAWIGGRSPAEALRRCLLRSRETCRESRRHTHPADWAALVVEGL